MAKKTNPFLEYYELGAKLNEINFAMQQAYLVPSKLHSELVIQELEILVGKTDETVSLTIKAVLYEWRDAWGDEGHMEELDEANNDYEHGGRASAEAACERLLTYNVSRLIERLHSALLAGNREMPVAIFVFGRVIDQSVRRDDIYRFLRHEVESGPVSNQNDKKLKKGTWKVGGHRQRSRIAERVCKPGFVPAGKAWEEAIHRCWRQLNIEVPIPDAAISNLVRRSRDDEAQNDYEIIDQAARRGLWVLWLNGPGRPQPEWDSGRRILRVADFTRRINPNAKNLILILDSFQELGWPPGVDNPVPPIGDKTPEKTLRDAVTGLNKGMEDCPIKFAMRNSGEGIGWDPKIPE